MRKKIRFKHLYEVKFLIIDKKISLIADITHTTLKKYNHFLTRRILGITTASKAPTNEW